MKLSEAILLGSVGSEQGFGPESIHPWYDKKCALGAALHAIGYKGALCYETVRKQWPWVMEDASNCPVCKHHHSGTGEIMTLIYALNDHHRWTRPQIAEWVASVEPQEVETPAIQEALVEQAY